MKIIIPIILPNFLVLKNIRGFKTTNAQTAWKSGAYVTVDQ